MENSNIEVLRGDPKVSIWKLSIPIMVTMIVTSLYNVVDGVWVAGLGQSAIAGIGLVTPLWMIINGVATGLGNGTTSSISRLREKYGDEKAGIVGSQSVIIFLVASIILTIALLLVLNPFLSIYHPSAQVSKEAIGYSVPLFLGLFGFVFSCGYSGILRAEGDTKRAMYATTIGIILNAIFDPIFIYVFNWGSAGASISTILTSLVSAIIMFYWIFVKRDTHINIKVKETLKSKWDWSITKDILSTGIPASAVLFMLSFAALIYYYFINLIAGNLGVGIFSSGYRLYLLGLMPITSMCSALVAIVGTHYGAGNFKYLKRTHNYCSLYAFIVGIIVCAIFVIFSDQMAQIFVFTANDPELVKGISLYIKITSFCFPFLGVGLPSSFMFQGLGKGVYSFIWTILYDIVAVVPMIYLFAFQLNCGLIGVWYGFVVGRATISVLNFIYLRLFIKKIEKSDNSEIQT